MTDYTVCAGYVTATTAVPGGRARIDIQRGAILPADVPAEEVEALLRLGDIEPAVDVEDLGDEQLVDEPPPPTVPVVGATLVDQVPDGTIADVLAWVGDDTAKAAAALAAEHDRGDAARKTLIAQLAELAHTGE